MSSYTDFIENTSMGATPNNPPSGGGSAISPPIDNTSTKRFVLQHILPLSQEASEIETQIMDAVSELARLHLETARAHGETASAEKLMEYAEVELRMELFAAAPPKVSKSKKSAAAEALDTIVESPTGAAPVISGTTVAERETQFQHHLMKLTRTQPLHPYTRTVVAYNEFKRKEEKATQDLKEKERLLSALRTVADLKAARLLALSRAV